MLACLGACADLAPPGGATLRTDELLFLAVQSTAPPVPSGTITATSATTTYRALHTDAFHTQFLELRIPAGAVPDPVTVRVDPEPGRYAATIGPGDLAFVEGTPAQLRFTFGTYGDQSVADGSSRYATRADYVAALTLWHEVGINQWERVAGATHPDPDTVAGPVAGSGRFAVAAPR